MTRILALLLLAAAPAAPAGAAAPAAAPAGTAGTAGTAAPAAAAAPAGTAAPAAAPAGTARAASEWRDLPRPGGAPTALESADDATWLCGALEPAERLRPAGDAVARGEAEAHQHSGRETALRARYEAVARAVKLAFAPYDDAGQRLALEEPAQLPVANGTLRLWPTEERGLAVDADPTAARRVLDAQRRGVLALSVVFDLPDDATCGAVARGKRFTLPVEPVSWRWLDGETVIAHGGAAAERPLVDAAQGARPRVDVGDPIAGPTEAKRAVAARSGDLLACYGEALKRDPATDGVLVADLAGAKPAIAADSVGDPGLAACVARALGPLAPAQGRVAVPIRFVLEPPGEGEAPPAAR